jgi:hypothetical protein
MSVGHLEALFVPCAVATVDLFDREDGAGAIVSSVRRSTPSRGVAGAA